MIKPAGEGEFDMVKCEDHFVLVRNGEIVGAITEDDLRSIVDIMNKRPDWFND